MSHRDTVFEAPGGFTALASSTASPVAAFESAERAIYGIQFHPEVVHTPVRAGHPQDVPARRLRLRHAWSAASIVEEQIARIRAQVGTGKVICGLSGGVDSSVAALLVHRAVGDQLTCVFVDHGLMRKNEGEQVIAAFRDRFGIPLVAVDAEERFLTKLRGVTDPEAKRKAIGTEFIRVFEEEAAKLAHGGEGARFLVQGTLYSDVIESGGGTGAATIKSHHNVGGLPDDLEFELVEPLRALFKDEVRAVGAELGMPERLVWRQPFPGPGLAIRIVGGEASKARLDLLRDADYILQDEIRNAGLYRELWQSFCVLPDIRTVGVQGDERTYGNVVVIRAVTSDDAMTADWARLPVRPARADRVADDQRAARGQPGGARHHEQAARDDRVGVAAAAARPVARRAARRRRPDAPAAPGRYRATPRAPRARARRSSRSRRAARASPRPRPRARPPAATPTRRRRSRRSGGSAGPRPRRATRRSATSRARPPPGARAGPPSTASRPAAASASSGTHVSRASEPGRGDRRFEHARASSCGRRARSR